MQCIDDCEACPLFAQCAGKCVRWNDLVCNDCSCLGSSYADVWGAVKTVDPKTNKPKGADPRLLEIRRRRKALHDGEPCNKVE